MEEEGEIYAERGHGGDMEGVIGKVEREITRAWDNTFRKMSKRKVTKNVKAKNKRMQ